MIKFNNEIYPLPYVGGKRRIVRRFVDKLLARLAPGVLYVEPFAGGLSVALTLLDVLPWLRAWVNDAYHPLCAYWRVVQSDPEYLISRVCRDHPEREAWDVYAGLTKNPAGVGERELAWAVYARYGWSFGQKGASFNPGFGARAYLATKVRQIRNAHRLLQRATITNLDFRDVLKHDEGVAYLDPPYMMATAKAGYYEHRFSHVDQLDLREMVLARRSPWLMSYDDHPAVWSRYRACRIEPVEFGRGLGGPARMYREVLITPC